MNSELKADNLLIDSFRGIPHQISLDLSDFTIIYGENGTGKSSIVDSLEFLFSGKLEHLKSSTIKKSAYVNNNSNKKDVSIELNLRNGEYCALKGTKKSYSHLFDEIFENQYMNNASFILNRKRLLEFIEGSQGDRYKAIIDLIGIKKLDKVQGILSPAIKNLKEEFEKAIEVHEFNLKRLEEFRYSKETTKKTKDGMKEINNSILKEIRILESKNEESLKDLSSLIKKNQEDYKKAIDDVNALLIKKDLRLLDESTDVDEFRKNLDSSSFLNLDAKINDLNRFYDKIDLNIKEDLDKVLLEYENIASENLKSSRFLIKTLETSIDYINISNSDTCPICNNDIDSNKIVDELNQKIDDINYSNLAYDNWLGNIKILNKSLSAKIKDMENLNDVILELNELTDEKIDTVDYSILNDLEGSLEEFANFKMTPSDFNKFDFNKLNQKLLSVKEQVSNIESNQDKDDYLKILDKLTEIKLFEQRKAEENNLRNLINQRELEIREKTNQISQNKENEVELEQQLARMELDIENLESQLNQLLDEIDGLEKQFETAQLTFDVFTKSKEEYINNMFSSIRDDIKYFYDYIHDDDSIMSPDIVVKGAKKIDVYLDSFGEPVDSRSFASEGHLDTLGICISLAFNKQFNDLPLMVLDDVLTTVDVPHKEKIARLLIEEFSDYQFIITAHNIEWINVLEELCNDYGKDNVVYEIEDWSLEDGPTIIER